MKNKNQLQLTLSTKTLIRHLTKTHNNQANKKRTKNEKFKIFKNPYKPTPILVQPQISKRTNVRKTPVFGAFYKEQKTDVLQESTLI